MVEYIDSAKSILPKEIQDLIPGGDKDIKHVGSGIVNPEVLVKLLDKLYDRHNPSGAADAPNGDLPPPKPDAPDAAHNPELAGMTPEDFAGTRNVLALLFKLLQQFAHKDAQAKKDLGDIGVQSLEMVDAYADERAGNMRDAGKSEKAAGITEGVTHGVAGLTGMGMGFKYENPAIATGASETIQGGGQTGKAFIDYNTACINAEIADDEGGAKAAEATMQGFDAAVQDTSSYLNKTQDAAATVAETEAKVIGAATDHTKI